MTELPLYTLGEEIFDDGQTLRFNNFGDLLNTSDTP